MFSHYRRPFCHCGGWSFASCHTLGIQWRFSGPAAFAAVGLRAATLRRRRRFAAATRKYGRNGSRGYDARQDRRHESMHADLDVSILELDRGSV